MVHPDKVMDGKMNSQIEIAIYKQIPSSKNEMIMYDCFYCHESITNIDLYNRHLCESHMFKPAWINESNLSEEKFNNVCKENGLVQQSGFRKSKKRTYDESNTLTCNKNPVGKKFKAEMSEDKRHRNFDRTLPTRRCPAFMNVTKV